MQYEVIGVDADGHYQVYFIQAANEEEARRTAREHFKLDVKAVRVTAAHSRRRELLDWEVIGVTKDTGEYVVRHVLAYEEAEARQIAEEQFRLDVKTIRRLPTEHAVPAVGCAVVCFIAAVIAFAVAFYALEIGEGASFIFTIAAGSLLIASVLLLGMRSLERLRDTLAYRR